MHARGNPGTGRHGHVHLEREAGTRGPGGAEEPGRVRSLRRPHHARRQVEQPREVRQIELDPGNVRGAREHRDGRGRRGRQLARERHARERPRVPLEEPREALEVVGFEIPHDARVVDRDGPHEVVVLAGRLVPAPRGGREPVQRLRRGLHGPRVSPTARRASGIGSREGQAFPRSVPAEARASSTPHQSHRLRRPMSCEPAATTSVINDRNAPPKAALANASGSSASQTWKISTITRKAT
jgi:hypothetical protein